jgi:uncharacterized heparinase superfamily protein
MMDRVLTFAGKAKHQGLGYVGAVSAYHVNSVRYQLATLTKQLGGSATTTSEAPRPPFHFDPCDIPAIVAGIPQSAKSATLSEARQYLEGRFSFRSLPEVYFPQAVDWDFAPEKNRSWSWDLNRHRFFLTLGTAYHYTQDTVYLDRLIALWHNWMRHNPAGKGRNWQSPFEVAARLRNWVWAYFLVAASPEASPLFLRWAWSGLSQHAAFLAGHLEYHWPNNHLLLEALSLCEFAVIFKGCGEERYLPLASRVLEEQVQRQVLADGVHGELCPMYHEIAAHELNAFARLCRRLQHPLPATMEERIRAMRRFSVALRRSDGSFPLLGDSSCPDTCLRFDAGEPGGNLAYWLPPDENLPAVTTPSPLFLDLFTEAGYGIMRNSVTDTHLTFDFGPFSRCAAANHGHADALSFELHAASRPWIVDSGFFYPWKDAAVWGSYFRSTAAHNTLLIDGKEQSELSQHWDIGRRAQARLAGYRSNSEEVTICGEVEPYWSGGEVVHRREVALNQTGEVTVRDVVLRGSLLEKHVSGTDVPGTRGYRLQWFFHFVADLRVEQDGANTILARGEHQLLVCEVCRTGPAPNLRLVRGQQLPKQGWVAQTSARVTPAWVLAVEAEAPLPYDITFHFRIIPVGTSTYIQQSTVKLESLVSAPEGSLTTQHSLHA